MCGICGIFDFSGKPVDLDLLEKMTQVIKHRGPDGEGRFAANEIGLGHRRLSIIDVGGGAQPMENEDGRIKIVFNGEIYNFLELRKELISVGHDFKTRSDTEVIVHAYEEWGKACVKHFNGMFAFALWDGRTQELFVARDHLGIKPLYYIELPRRLLFASEIKALLQDTECPREVDTEALCDLFTYRYVPSPKTLFKHIRKLPPGYCMTASRKGIQMERFWNSVPKIRQMHDEQMLVEEYRSLLEDAVRIQLRSDVPLGLFLSSGVDSGALLAIMNKFSTTPIKTFTIGFEGGEKTNEVDDAQVLAKMFGADHSFMVVKPEDYLQYYENYLWDLEEPVGNESAAAFYFVSKITSASVKVALTGQGADEPWAGYDRYKGIKLSSIYSRLPSFLTRMIADVVTRIPGRYERMKRGVLSLSEADMLTRFVKVYSFFSEDMKQRLFKGELKTLTNEYGYSSKKALQHLQRNVSQFDPLTQMLYIDTRANLPDDLLMVGDKTSMANSLEVRVPYLDYRLVEFIESLPPSLKLKGLTGKYLHKKAMEKYLPKNFIYQKKKGFANPIEEWFRTRMKMFVEEFLLSPNAGVSQYFDQKYIRQMIDQDRLGKEQLRRHIYLLVSFEMWHRLFIKA